MTKCPIATAVAADIERRAEVGLQKYGTTMARTDLSREQWLQHMYEELLDAAIYTRRLIEMEKPAFPPSPPIPEGQGWRMWSTPGWWVPSHIDMLFTDNSVKLGVRPENSIAFRNAKAWRPSCPDMVGG